MESSFCNISYYINKEHIQRQHWLHTLYTGTTRNHHKQKLKPLTRKLTRKPHQYSRVYVFYLHCRCILTSSQLNSATDLVLVRLLHSMWHYWRIHWRTLWRRSLSSPTRSLQHCLLACTLCSATVYVHYDHSSQTPGTTSLSHSVTHTLPPSSTSLRLEQICDTTLPYLTLQCIGWVSK
jgi:hypothetical protein